MISLLAVCASAQDRTDLEVDVVNGGLGRASFILIARNGTSINYEGVPRNLEGIHFVSVPSSKGWPFPTTPQQACERGLKFSYPADASPRAALDAAVAAANAQPDAISRYRVIEQEGQLDLVPYEVRDASGWHPYTPLLDTVITLPNATGTPTALYRSLMPALTEAAHVQVLDGSGHSSLDLLNPEDRITLPSATGPARTLLDQIFAHAQFANHWFMVWVYASDPEVAGWYILFTQVQPEDEAMLNRTPLPRPAP